MKLYVIAVTEANRHEQGAAIQDKLYHGGISAAMEGVPGGMGEEVARFLTDYFFGEIYTRYGKGVGTGGYDTADSGIENKVIVFLQ